MRPRAEGMWRWVDGTVLSLDKPSWCGGEPEGGVDNNCLKVARVLGKNQDKRPSESCEEQDRGLCEKKIIKCLLKTFLCAYFGHVPHYSAILFHTFGVPSFDKSCDWLQGSP